MSAFAALVGFVAFSRRCLSAFYPLEFWGLELIRVKDQPFGLFGWQGIIPTKTAKMSGDACELMTDKLIDIKEVFGRLDATEFGKVMEIGLVDVMDDVITTTFSKHVPGVWKMLPEGVKEEIVIKSVEECPVFLKGLMEDVKEHILDIFDLKAMVIEKCCANKQLMINVFQSCGTEEFKFIERSGFYFGFLFGMVQMTVYMFYTASWVLPAFGFLVGVATNWIALKIIFEPIEKKKICCGKCFEFQGLFLRRQDVVSEIFAKVNVEEILTSANMWEAILTGPKSSNFYELLRAHTVIFAENMAGGFKPLVVAAVGKQKFEDIKQDIGDRTVTELPNVIHFSYDYTEKALDLQSTICKAMKNLTSAEFEGVLHPVFEEDELKLIIVGGVLGLGVGFVQNYALF